MSSHRIKRADRPLASRRDLGAVAQCKFEVAERRLLLAAACGSSTPSVDAMVDRRLSELKRPSSSKISRAPPPPPEEPVDFALITTVVLAVAAGGAPAQVIE
jgi:hypothetical protein